MKFAKIVCGAIQVPQNYPCQIVLDGQVIVNPTEEQYRSAGYLPLEETEPEEIEGKIAIAVYTENKRKKKIVQSWTYVDAPEEEPMPGDDPIEEEM